MVAAVVVAAAATAVVVVAAPPDESCCPKYSKLDPDRLMIKYPKVPNLFYGLNPKRHILAFWTKCVTTTFFCSKQDTHFTTKTTFIQKL